MKVSISALGAMRKYLPDERVVELEDPPPNLIQLISRKFGVPQDMSRIGYVVNDSIKKQTYVPKPGDKIVFMILGGAG